MALPTESASIKPSSTSQNLPTGTVTLLFTDIEGSSALWERHADKMSTALARHNEIIYQAAHQFGGYIFKTMRDGICIAFAVAPNAVQAALTAQRLLQVEPWDELTPIYVRMGLHTGTCDVREGDYVGPPLNRVARLMAAAYGRQTLLSRPTEELVRHHLSAETSLLDLGQVRLRDLAWPEQVFQLVHPDLELHFPPLRSMVSVPNNLPVQRTSFVGREKEITEVKSLLEHTRLLTLTGAGGTGKTRISLQTAADLLELYPDGIWLVELAPRTDPNLVLQAVAEVMGVYEERGKPLSSSLLTALKTRHVLLVLDNCEHLIVGCRSVVSDIIRVCPNVRIMASSREPLGVSGEQIYRVPSLALPERITSQKAEDMAKYEALSLFEERAKQVMPTFSIRDENLRFVIEICRRLDGIPLAIELAAARARTLPVDEILTRLDNRFALLTGGPHDVSSRQQTLQALIDWSYDLLNERERSTLLNLSVFSGGWTLAAASSVCAADGVSQDSAVDVITDLVDKSLVIYKEGNIDDRRYRLQETVQQYARERLQGSGVEEDVCQRHCDCFLAQAENADAQLRGPKQQEWLERVEIEHDNFRAALSWCQQKFEDRDATARIQMGVRIAGALGRFWMVRGYWTEGRRLIALQLANIPDIPSPAQSKAMYWAAMLASRQGDYGAAQSLFQQSLEISREMQDEQGMAWALCGYAQTILYYGDYDEAQVLFQQSLGFSRKLKDQAGISDALSGLGDVAYSTKEYKKAGELYQQGLEIENQLEGKQGIASFIHKLASVAFYLDGLDAARELWEKSLEISRQIGNPASIATTIRNLAIVAENQLGPEVARELYGQALEIRRGLGDRAGIADGLKDLGDSAYKQNDYTAARELYGQDLEIRRELKDKAGIVASLNSLGGVAFNQDDYATARGFYQQSLEICRTSGNQENIAVTLKNLGAVAEAEGDFAGARELYQQSLEICRTLSNQENIADGLDGLADVANAQGDHKAARELYEQSLTIRKKQKQKTLSYPLSGLADAAYAEGDYSSANQLYKQCLAGMPNLGDKKSVARILRGLAAVATAQSQDMRAIRLFGAAEKLHEAVGDFIPVREQKMVVEQISGLRKRWEEIAFTEAWTEGREMVLEQAVEFAQSSD